MCPAALLQSCRRGRCSRLHTQMQEACQRHGMMVTSASSMCVAWRLVGAQALSEEGKLPLSNVASDLASQEGNENDRRPASCQLQELPREHDSRPYSLQRRCMPARQTSLYLGLKRMWLTRVVDALAPRSVEDGHREDDHICGAIEPGLCKYWAENHDVYNGWRVVLGVVWWVDDAAVDDTELNAPAKANPAQGQLLGA